MYYLPFYYVPQASQAYPYFGNPYHNPYYNYSYAPYIYPTNVNAMTQPIPYYVNWWDPRQYPNVDSTIFNESAVAFKKLLQDASMVLNRLADSKEFATKVMTAAQASDLEEVDRLIKSTGIQSNFKTTFNPDGIGLYFWSNVEETECCKLDMKIRWN